MKTTPILYNNKQLDEIQQFISDNFGNHGEFVAHELESDFVHTDVAIIAPPSSDKTFVTFGMGARKMETPVNLKRCELVMSVCGDIDIQSNESFIIANELTKISKFPFREETWLGTGHTIDASKRFKETFGYDYFAFRKLSLSAKLTGIKEDINFLIAVPIYEQEREWCVNNHTLALLDKLNEIYNGKELDVGFKREPFVPEPMDQEEISEYNLMTVLGIERDALAELSEYLELQEHNGVEITYEMISKWVESNL